MDTTFLQQAFSDSQVLTVPWSIDYFSVVVGVLTGALFACDRKLDIIGTVVLGLVTGYGGGIIRDMLLQTHGVYFTSHPDLILICIAICTFVFYFRGLFRHLDATVFFADNTYYTYQSFDPATASVTPTEGGYQYANDVSILDGEGNATVTNVLLVCDADGNVTSMTIDGALLF